MKKYGYFDESHKERFLQLIKRGYAAFIYCDNVFNKGELIKLSDGSKTYRTIAVNSAIHLPLCFFENNTDIAVNCSGGSIILKSREKRVELLINNASSPDAAKHKEGTVYIPAAYTFEKLSIPYSIYNNGRLIVFGDQEIIDEMNASEELVFAAENAIFGEYNVNSFTDNDFKIAKDKWREKLVGNPTINSATDESTVGKIKRVDELCRESLSLLNRADDRVILFGDTPATESSHLTRQYSHLERIAKAYSTYGSEFYGNPELRDIVMDGVEWLYRNLYGEAEINGTGWRDVHTFNWWDWHVGAADPLTDIMLMMEDEFTMEMKERYLRCHLFCCTFMRTGPDRSMASSRIKIYTKEALLLCNRKMLYDEYVDYDILLNMYYTGEGMHLDYVHWTHGMPYNLTYGVIDLERLLYTGSILAGTPLEFKNPKQYNLFDKLKYCYEPAIFRGMAFNMFRGRANSGTEYSSGAEIMAEILPLIGMFGEEEDLYIKSFIKRNICDDEMLQRVRKYCSLVDLAMLNSILDADITPEKYVYTHAWYTGDRAAHQKGDYAFGLSLCSEREPNYESINGENKQGWYTNDGALYLYTDRDRHSFDGSNFINCEGVAYKIPGTTVDAQPRIKKTISRAWKMPRDFVGTMSLDSSYLVGTIDYESYNFAGPDQGIPDTYHGGSLPFHDNDLVAKKSYFMFDKECVCLGAGISSSMNSPVCTVLEHRRVLQNEGDTVSADGRLLCGKSFKERIEAHYYHREGVGGFILSEPCNTVCERYRDESEKDNAFYRETPNVDYDFEHQDYIYFMIDHGVNPQNASYHYTVLPLANIEETKAYCENPETDVISNTPELQAVKKESLGVAFAVFHKAGSINVFGKEFIADSPCLVSFKRVDGGISLRISDPTHKLETLRLCVGGAVKAEKSLDYDVERGDASTAFIVKTAFSMGAPFDIKIFY